jgi:hypothetical protein
MQTIDKCQLPSDDDNILINSEDDEWFKEMDKKHSRKRKLFRMHIIFSKVLNFFKSSKPLEIQYHYGDTVVLINGLLNGVIGTVISNSDYKGWYGVKIPGDILIDRFHTQMRIFKNFP